VAVPEFLKFSGAPLVPAVSPAEARGRLSPTVEQWRKPIRIGFLVVWAVNWVLLLLGVELPREGRWMEALLPIFAVLTTLLALGRRLPLQNVVMAAVLIAGASLAIAAVGAKSGVPFGPFVYGSGASEELLGVTWWVPLLWVVLLINGRGVARLVMRPWRKTNFYGYWVIGITCVLVVLFDLGFEPFAVQVKGHWVWLTTKSTLTWHTAPWVNFVGWFIAALGILVFTIPWLINKQPVKQPMDYHPLVVWLLLNLWVATGNAREQLWSAVLVALVGNVVATVYAVRGARW
jgi:uncharacterized membrane protein